MIKCSQINKSYVGKKVLSNVSFSIGRGELLIINGNSGVGKTTLLNIIAGVSKPDNGSCEVLTKRIGYAFQDDRLIPWVTVQENLNFVLAGFFLKDEVQTIASFWLKNMGLEESAQKLPGELSGGMKKRLNLARCFAINPELLLLDEPLAFQDDQYQQLITTAVLDLQQRCGATVVVTGHGDATAIWGCPSKQVLL